MAADYDASEFVDGDLQSQKESRAVISAAGSQFQRAPSREEVDSKVVEAQQKLAELRRAQQDLEHQRAALEETHRRQMELQTGRQEMMQHLTRALGLLEEAEFSARRDAEQMAKTLSDLREALSKVEVIRQETWTEENFDVELTRSLTTLENARMEWNSARLKFPLLSGTTAEGRVETSAGEPPTATLFGARTPGELSRLGLALTWPLAVTGLLAAAALVVLLLLKR